MTAAPVTPPSAPKRDGRRWLSRMVAVVYGLVMFEVVIMISPFAFYFYAAYGPALRWLNHSRATAWLTGFLLPHAVFTTSSFLEFLRWDLGRYAFGFGLVGFLLLALQIYGSHLFGRKVVTSGAYRYVRHPQYLCLSISAFGLFTMWPRTIIFLLFLGMLFAYYFLACVEERRMLVLYPEYAEHMRSTGMFLPGNPGGRIFKFVFGGMRDQRLAARLAIVSSACVILLAGAGLRAYTLGHLSRSTDTPNTEIISVYSMTAEDMQRVVALAVSDSRVRRALEHAQSATFVVHILPHDYGMIGMFADVGSHHMRPGNIRLSGFKYLVGCLLPFLDVHPRTDLMGSDGQEYRLVFSRVDGPDGRPVPLENILALSAKMTPVYVADVNSVSGHVGETIDPPGQSFWGDVKMPIF
ncbi:MAG TPA: isoprenylcysteine carboxylmethyltransferase family protein [Terriglobales bacterium]|nr:isoprenylcysteine carboxylmethyltransferase family protein [Terriglobales bacterium]